MAFAPPRASDRVKTSHLMRSIFDAMPDAVVLADDGGEILLVNELAATLFRYERELMPGMDVEDLIAERFRQVHQAFVAATTANPSASVGRWVGLCGRTSDGTEFPIESSVTFTSSTFGRLAIEVLRDRSDDLDRTEAVDVARQRIGQDISEVVVGRLLSVGLTMQSAAQLVRDTPAARRIRDALHELDVPVRALRRSIYAPLNGGAGTTTDPASESKQRGTPDGDRSGATLPAPSSSPPAPTG